LSIRAAKQPDGCENAGPDQTVAGEFPSRGNREFAPA